MKSRLVFGVLVAVIMTANCALVVPTARATPPAPDWINGDPIIKKSDRPYSAEKCIHEMRQITLNAAYYYKEEDKHPRDWCVYHYRGFDIAFYKRWFSNVILDASDTLGLYPREESSMAISFDGGALVPVSNVSYEFRNIIVYSPGLDNMLFRGPCNGMGCELHVTSFDKSRFSLIRGTGGYLYTPGEDKSPTYDDGINILGAGFNVSDNGQWVSFVIGNVGLVEMDTRTLKMQLVNMGWQYSVPSYVGNYSPVTAVDDSGNLLFFSGSNGSGATVINSTGDCSIDVIRPNYISPLSASATCAFKYIDGDIINAVPLLDGYRNISQLDLDAAGVHAHLLRNGGDWYDLYPWNALLDSKMTYLALGDSYSSGEGDIERGAYHYLPNTNVLGSYKDGIPRELCHVSNRSYPFLLAKDMGIVLGSDMQSIACSGAVRNDVDAVGASGYLGQPVLMANGTMPRLNGLVNAVDLQNAAESSFIPGRVRQIELVKKYKPKIVTIGISGNDLGFGNIVTDCILNLGFGDCQYAEDRGKKELGSAISANYDKQVALYAALKAASPGTDFYAVGYPQFITDDSFCLANADALNQAEREMIRNAVTYTNATIKHAAATAGIKYIDIEHSLDGKKMCEGSDAVVTPAKRVGYGLMTDMTFEDDGRIDSLNGVMDYIHKVAGDYYRESKESLSANPIMAAQLAMQEAFHPNAVGHQLIYDYIHDHMDGTSLLDATCDNAVIVCPLDENKNAPVEPDYFGKSDEKTDYYQMLQNAAAGGQIVQAAIPMNGTVQRGTHVTVGLPSGTLSAGTSAKVVLRSEPMELSSIRAGDGGELSGDMLIPADTPVGYHSVAVTFIDSDGNSAKYIQPIFVTGPVDDIDGDGVLNSSDTCEFLTPSGVDSDGDGIDDNCDLQSNQPTVSRSISAGSVKERPVADAVIITDNWAAMDTSTNSSPNQKALPNLKAAASNTNVTSKDDDTITESIIVWAAGVFIMLMTSLRLLAKRRK